MHYIYQGSFTHCSHSQGNGYYIMYFNWKRYIDSKNIGDIDDKPGNVHWESSSTVNITHAQLTFFKKKSISKFHATHSVTDSKMKEC